MVDAASRRARNAWPAVVFRRLFRTHLPARACGYLFPAAGRLEFLSAQHRQVDLILWMPSRYYINSAAEEAR